MPIVSPRRPQTALLAFRRLLLAHVAEYHDRPAVGPDDLPLPGTGDRRLEAEKFFASVAEIRKAARVAMRAGFGTHADVAAWAAPPSIPRRRRASLPTLWERRLLREHRDPLTTETLRLRDRGLSLHSAYQHILTRTPRLLWARGTQRPMSPRAFYGRMARRGVSP